MKDTEEGERKVITAYNLSPRLTEKQARTLGCLPEPGKAKREWMDSTKNNFAYKCLPLTIANMHGWDFLCPCDIEIIWNGGSEVRDVRTRHMTPKIPKGQSVASSHFGSGTVTFTFPYLFKTPPGWGLMVQGPPNNPKRGITALQGIVETDWLPGTFTMNWKITEPWYTIKFEKGEPICRIMPIKFPDIEEWEFENPPIDSNPELKESYEKWRVKRDALLTHLHEVTPETGDLPETYNDHDYIKGEVGGATPEHHRSTLKLNRFEFGKYEV